MEHWTLVYHTREMKYAHYSFKAENIEKAWEFVHWKFYVDKIKIVRLLNE